jgi:purine-nucleoside phosphorylase
MRSSSELLEQPKMSNHARGLWGYSGSTPDGDELTIQATGMGGPSAAMVLADLAELGVRRVVRVGTCAALRAEANVGDLLLAGAAVATTGSAASFGLAAGETASPDPLLLERLRVALGRDAREATIASVDTMPASVAQVGEATAADMQTLAVLARAHKLGIAAAAALVVSEAEENLLDDDTLAAVAKLAGHAAAKSLSR